MERMELSQDLGRDILAIAKRKGASAGDAVMVESESFSVTVRMEEVEKISQAGEKRMGCDCFSATARLRRRLRTFRGNLSKSWSTTL